MLYLNLIRVAEVKDRLAELVAYFLQQIQIKMVVGEFALVRSTEASLERKSVRDVHFLPHDNTSCRFLRLLHRKGTIGKVEYITVLVHQAREDALFQTIVDATTVTVHEDVLLARMAMQVAYEEDISVFLQLLNHALHMVHCRVKLSRRINPASVQVNSGQIAPRTAIDDTINVEHRNDLENEVVAEDLCLQERSCQVINDTLHHPAGTCLSRMNTRRYYNTFARLDSLRVTLEGCDDEHVAVVTSNGLAQRLSSHAILSFRVCLEAIDVAAQVSVSIGVAVREVDYIRVMFEGDAPCERIVVSSILTAHRVLIVADVEAAAHPATPRPLGLGLRVDKWAHAVIIKRVWLHQVDDIEPVLLSCAHIPNSEVVPLNVAARIVVGFQYQIILVLINLNGTSQVARLEARLK